jgi:hypothetical protein
MKTVLKIFLVAIALLCMETTKASNATKFYDTEQSISYDVLTPSHSVAVVSYESTTLESVLFCSGEVETTVVKTTTFAEKSLTDRKKTLLDAMEKPNRIQAPIFVTYQLRNKYSWCFDTEKLLYTNPSSKKINANLENKRLC